MLSFERFLMSGGAQSETKLAHLGHLGGILGVSRSILAHLGVILGVSQSILAHLGAILEAC